MSTQYLFYSGKGGVGKTSMACVTAVRLADEGKRTLIVTTDPASNLADVFEQKIGHEVTPITGVKNLWAMEIDPDIATTEYIDKAMAPIRAAFPPQIVQVMEEQMSGPCTAEVAAFDRFTDFLETDKEGEKEFDVVIFDTAPTGHTIRLLELPAEWSQSIDAASEGSGQTCIGLRQLFRMRNINTNALLGCCAKKAAPFSISFCSRKRSRSKKPNAP